MDSPDTSAKQRRPKNKKDMPEVEVEDDEFFKKWAGAVLIGPFVPAVFALLVIVCGQLVLNTWTGTCGYALDCKYLMCNIVFILLSQKFLGSHFLQRSSAQQSQ